MVVLKTKKELTPMQEACRISAQALQRAGEVIRPGITTAQIDHAIHDFIRSRGAVPSFLGYGGFPASACFSVNDELILGIPGPRVIQEGDIVSVDVGAFYNSVRARSSGPVLPPPRLTTPSTISSVRGALCHRF